MVTRRIVERFSYVIPLGSLFLMVMFLIYIAGNEKVQIEQAILYFILGISFLSFGILYYRYRKEAEENRLLLKVIDRVKNYASEELETVHALSDTIKNREEQYKYIESSLQRLYEKIEQTKDEGESKSQFLSTMSHEIRTPLNGMRPLSNTTSTVIFISR